jgi:YidB-like protein
MPALAIRGDIGSEEPVTPGIGCSVKHRADAIPVAPIPGSSGSATSQVGITQSWIGNGPNRPVSPKQLQTVFGEDQVQTESRRSGMALHYFLSQLSQHLPSLVHTSRRMVECLRNGSSLSAQNLGALLMKCKIISPLRRLLARYITIIYIVLRLGASAVYIIPISSFIRHRAWARKQRANCPNFIDSLNSRSRG